MKKVTRRRTSSELRPNPSSAKEIGRRLRQLRVALNLTQEEMAARIGLSQASAWNHYEQGLNAPKWETAVRIAIVTGVSMDWIYRDESGHLPLNLAKVLPPSPDSSG